MTMIGYRKIFWILYQSEEGFVWGNVFYDRHYFDVYLYIQVMFIEKTFVYSSIQIFTHSFTHSFSPSSLYSFFCPFVHSFSHPCLHSFICSLVHLFVRSFIRSLIHFVIERHLAIFGGEDSLAYEITTKLPTSFAALKYWL